MITAYILFGIWIGMIITYFEWYVPMYRKIKNLEEGMKDCIKAGLVGPEPDDEMEEQQ